MHQREVDVLVLGYPAAQCVGTPLGQCHVVGLARFGRSVTRYEYTSYLEVAVVAYGFDGVLNRVELGAVVLVVGTDVMAVLAEVEPCGAGLYPGLDRLRLGLYRGKAVARHILGQHGEHVEAVAPLLAVDTAVNFLADFEAAVEHPARIGNGCGVVVALLFAVVSQHYGLGAAVVVGRQLDAFEHLRPVVDLAARPSVDHNRGKLGLGGSVLRHYHGNQGHGVLRPDSQFRHVHSHGKFHVCTGL